MTQLSCSESPRQIRAEPAKKHCVFNSAELDAVLDDYRTSFGAKVFGEESSEEEDDLMLVFGLTQTAKAANKQYWGRELGMCWQRLLMALCRQTCSSFDGPIREGADEICDFRLGKDAVDTKYRIGSGDSGTLKKFKQYASRLKALGYKPMLLILRSDNLPAALTACTTGGWVVASELDAYEYIRSSSGVDLQKWLRARRGKFSLS